MGRCAGCECTLTTRRCSAASWAGQYRCTHSKPKNAIPYLLSHDHFALLILVAPFLLSFVGVRRKAVEQQVVGVETALQQKLTEQKANALAAEKNGVSSLSMSNGMLYLASHCCKYLTGACKYTLLHSSPCY